MHWGEHMNIGYSAPAVKKQLSPALITQTNAGVAGALYSQEQVQSIADLANANKARLNELILKLKDAGVLE